MKTPELKPCPFCGSKPKLAGAYTIEGVTAWAVYCGKTPSDFFCGAQITSIESEEKAVEAWNRRVTDAES